MKYLWALVALAALIALVLCGTGTIVFVNRTLSSGDLDDLLGMWLRAGIALAAFVVMRFAAGQSKLIVPKDTA